MKILSAKQTREADQYTIEHEPISSLDLMERASSAFTSWFTTKYDTDSRVLVVAGTGNNGGDGLVISRLLLNSGYEVRTVVVRGGVPESEDFKHNYQRLSEIQKIAQVSDAGELSNLNSEQIDVVVEGIFGSGLSRPLTGLYLQVVEYLNHTYKPIISIDVPSGLFSDQHTGTASIHARYTVSFQRPKLAFLMAENETAVGEWVTVDIGLDEKYIESVNSDYLLCDQQLLKGFLKKRNKHAHKGTFGKALLIAGSLGKVGAAVLAARASLRSGLGLLTIHAPSCAYEILQTSVAEAMVSLDSGEKYLESAPDTGPYDAVGLGPGMGTGEATRKMVSQLLQSNQLPMVIDADALNILAGDKELLEDVPRYSILTPHVKELERLTGTATDDFDRLGRARDLSSKYELFIVLKGAYTAVCCPDGRVMFNCSGNPGMATGGSGDVLTGILTGLLAQKRYSTEEAVLLGVYLHGLTGDIAAERLGQESLIASDLVDSLPRAFQRLF